MYPSNGLHGFEFLHYHTLSHYLYASISLILNISVLEVYAYLTGFILNPVLILLLYYTGIKVWRVKSLLLRLIVLLAVAIFYINPLPLEFQNIFLIWKSYLISESYLLSLILFVSFLSYINSNDVGKTIVLPLLIFLIGFSKISVGYVAMIILITDSIFFNTSNSKKKYIQIIISSAILLVFSTSLVFNLTYNTNTSKTNIDFFYLFKSYSPFLKDNYSIFRGIIAYCLHNIIFLVCALFFFIPLTKKKNKLELKNFTLALITFLGTFPIIHLTMPGGSGVYFTELTNFVSTIFFLGLFNRIVMKKTLLIGFILIFLFNAYSYYISGLIKIKPIINYYSNFKENLYYTSLQKLNKMDKAGSIIYIPKTSYYWKESSNSVVRSFFPTAITGLSMLYGINDPDYLYYGYGVYSNEIREGSMKPDYLDEELIKEASKLGFKKIFKLEGFDWRTIEVRL